MAKKSRDKSNDVESNVKFAGLSTSSVKVEKTALCILEYYPKQERIFLSRLYEKFKNDSEESADSKIIELLNMYSKNLKSTVFDSPIELPKCLRCNLKCPGFEVCDVPEVKYSRQVIQQLNKNKKPQKTLSPYTYRAADYYLQDFCLEHKIKTEVHPTIGSNQAALVARNLFLKKRLTCSTFETQVKISAYLIAEYLKMNKTQYLHLRDVFKGEDSRRIFLNLLIDKKNIFVYRQDLKFLVENIHCFDAFVAALTAYFKYSKSCIGKPKNFPKDDLFPVIPSF
jgi:hypothetical protein